jgi:hypothetical protein
VNQSPTRALHKGRFTRTAQVKRFGGTAAKISRFGNVEPR